MTNSPAFQPNQFLIMAVDDVPANLKVLQGVLNLAGYRTTFATRGPQVLDRLHKVKPDLILLDLMMPEMSGTEVCAQIKLNPDTASIPIIFVTASHEIDALTQAFDCGAVDYVTKPFNATELLARIRTHLELSHLRKQAQRQAQREAISRQIVQDIHASIRLEDILNNAVEAIQQMLKAHRVMIYRTGTPKQGQPLALACDTRASDLATHSDLCAQGVNGPSLHHHAPEKPVEQQGCSFEAPPLPPPNEASLGWDSPGEDLCLPIYQQGRPWGHLMVQGASAKHPWAEPDCETLALIAQQLEIAIHHAEMHQRLEAANQDLKRLSNTDGLTQIANRRCFDQRLVLEWRRLKREKCPLALILCDIDYFKQFNDTYGHLAGDTCLVAVAQTLEICLKRPADLVARYGGEEFVMLLPNTGLGGAIEIVKQIQTAIAALDLVDAPAHRITLSFGIHTAVPQPFTAASTALTLADKALYAAKQAGRNRYMVAPQPTMPPSHIT